MTALASTRRPDWRSSLFVYRDDGPLARALGPVAPARLPAPLPLLLAPLPLLALLVGHGDDASHGAVAAAVAWAVLAGGLSRGCSHSGRLAWLVPPLLRALEYGSIVAIAAVSSETAPGGAYALLAAIAFHHYDLVYRLRYRGDSPPTWVSTAGGGWDGRLAVAGLLLAAGALPAGFYLAAALLGAVLVSESAAGWVAFVRSGGRVIDDEDDEDEEP